MNKSKRDKKRLSLKEVETVLYRESGCVAPRDVPSLMLVFCQRALKREPVDAELLRYRKKLLKRRDEREWA